MSTEDKQKIWRYDYHLQQQLERHESREVFPYVDTVGKVSIGIGRNLTDRGLSAGEIELLYRNDIDLCVSDLDRNLGWWRSLNECRQRVLLDMCFNLGINRLLGFHTSLRLMSEGKYQEASDQMLRSKWARQVKGRALSLSRIMKEGVC